MVQNVRYSNGLQSQVTLPFEYQTLLLSGIQMVTVIIQKLDTQKPDKSENHNFLCLMFKY